VFTDLLEQRLPVRLTRPTSRIASCGHGGSGCEARRGSSSHIAGRGTTSCRIRSSGMTTGSRSPAGSTTQHFLCAGGWTGVPSSHRLVL